MNLTFHIDTKSKRGPKLHPVNVSRISRDTGFTKGHISRVFAKKTAPSLKCLVSIAGSIGLSIDETLTRIQGRKFRVRN